MATVAPVVVSLAIWFITKSAFALVFAALGPAVAIASLADARIQGRRKRRREGERFRAELAAARTEVAAAHERERHDLATTLPSARRLVQSTWSEPERWLAGPDDPVLVGIGTGERASAASLEGAAATTRSRDPAHDELRLLAQTVARLPDAPLVVDARLGIGIVGARVVAASALRGFIVQVLATLSPAHSVVVETDARAEWQWLELLPHATTITTGPLPRTVVRVRASAGVTEPGAAHEPGRELGRERAREPVLAIAQRPDLLPTDVRVVVVADGARAHIDQHPDRAYIGPLGLEWLSREEAVSIVRGMAAHALRAGFGDAALPDSLTFAQCFPDSKRSAEPGAAPSGLRTALSAVVAVTAHDALRLDLVAHGPHAVVGGTTGSGKSELLTAWILAIARDHSPAEASVLLVDFKGGSAFASLETLPHCVGMITDLDETGAQRALESLAAELRRRERILARAAAKSIDALPPESPLPRLVIVVDEFAAMVSGFPELHSLFADIAARGRSLGVHLVLCTQRPAGVIRDSVLANSALRLSLRVNNRADSVAVIGTDAAARLPIEPRGRAFVTTDGDRPMLAQFPLVTQHDIDRVADRWRGDPRRPHRPWLDPLPSTVALDAVRPSRPAHSHATNNGHADRQHGVPFGLLDDPANQSQPVAVYLPVEHGNMLVVGASGSGKSTLLTTLAASTAAHTVPGDIEGAWDALTALAAELHDSETRTPPAPQLVVLDDLDALLGRFPEEYEAAVLELITRCLREGPARGIHWVITAQRLTPGLHPVVGLCASRLLLRLPNRQEHVLAGGDGAQFIERLPPGAGRWQGLRVQVAVVGDASSPASRPASGPASDLTAASALSQRGATRLLDANAPLAVVSNRPAQFIQRLRRAVPAFAEPGAIVEIGAAAPGITVAGPTSANASSANAVQAIVGDVDAWQSQWGALAAARSTHSVVVDACSASEFRAVTRIRALPPVLDDRRSDTFWLLDTRATVTRATLRTNDSAP